MLAALAAAALVTLLSVLALAGTAQRANAAPARNGSELTAQWWQWALSIPASENPLLDETGDFAGVGQPYEGNKVFFLCGVFNVSGTAERSITLPAGTPLFFPVLNNCWINNSGGYHRRHGGDAPDLTVPQMYAFVADQVDAVTEVHVTLDGFDLSALAARIASLPFAVHMPDDNVWGLPGGTYSPGVSDGYWVYLAPLAKGGHVLNFGGSGAGGFTLDITYNITVE